MIMADESVLTPPGDPASDTAPVEGNQKSDRLFLCVVDSSEECRNNRVRDHHQLSHEHERNEELVGVDKSYRSAQVG